MTSRADKARNAAGHRYADGCGFYVAVVAGVTTVLAIGTAIVVGLIAAATDG